MPVASQRTTTLYSVAGLGAPAQGVAYTRGWRTSRAKMPVEVIISAGTATVSIESRANANSAWVAQATVSASGISLVDEGLEYRVNVTAATGATIRVECDTPLRLVAQRTIA